MLWAQSKTKGYIRAWKKKGNRSPTYSTQKYSNTGMTLCWHKQRYDTMFMTLLTQTQVWHYVDTNTGMTLCWHKHRYDTMLTKPQVIMLTWPQVCNWNDANTGVLLYTHISWTFNIGEKCLLKVKPKQIPCALLSHCILYTSSALLNQIPNLGGSGVLKELPQANYRTGWTRRN